MVTMEELKAMELRATTAEQALKDKDAKIEQMEKKNTEQSNQLQIVEKYGKDGLAYLKELQEKVFDVQPLFVNEKVISNWKTCKLNVIELLVKNPNIKVDLTLKVVIDDKMARDTIYTPEKGHINSNLSYSGQVDKNGKSIGFGRIINEKVINQFTEGWGTDAGGCYANDWRYYHEDKTNYH